MTREQFQEMDSMDIKLSRFFGGINKLKEIVKIVNGYRNQSDWDKAIDYKNDVERSAEYQRYFEVIPFLKKLLKEYWEELKKNPLKTRTKAEEIIDQLVVA